MLRAIPVISIVWNELWSGVLVALGGTVKILSQIDLAALGPVLF